MCGIAGILDLKGGPVETGLIKQMTEAMVHRGPDAVGYFEEDGITLGHRRLSIIDLSSSANQPFKDNSGRYILLFNGEIYNYAALKTKLQPYPFCTNSDTEVILVAYMRWGADCLTYLRGMYTIAIWDREEKELFIARDRLGVKPLYYFHQNNQFIFASEIRAILATGKMKRDVDLSALSEYFCYQSVGFPFSPVKGIRQLEAGVWMKIKNNEIITKQYWDPVAKNYDFDFTGKKDVQRKVKELMLQSVERRLVSDVPVGAFLSGGIDSSALVGLMVEAGESSPNTFNISFDELAYDESEYANLIAKRFNTRHTQVRLKPEVMLEELTNALDAMDIPSGDGINTYLVSKAVHKEGIRVALSGAGGDELFVGYSIFDYYIRIQQKRWLWKMPVRVRNRLSVLLGNGINADRIRQLLAQPSPAIDHVYPILRQLLSPAALQRLTTLPRAYPGSFAEQLSSKRSSLNKLPFFSQVTAAEYLGYAQQTLLKDTDQMSMANSLEIREPFFDQDLVEFVMSIPDHFKVPVYPKSLLVESLKPLLPDEIVHRKKQGFVFPWKEWMKKELRSFCELHIHRIAERDFINGPQLQKTWDLFLAGDPAMRWQEIWLFVVLNYWMERNSVV